MGAPWRTVPYGCGFKLFHATPMSFELNTASDRDFLEPCKLLKLWPWRCLDTEQCTKFYIYFPIIYLMYIQYFAKFFRQLFLRFEKLLDIIYNFVVFQTWVKFPMDCQTIKTWCNIENIIINNCKSQIHETE